MLVLMENTYPEPRLGDAFGRVLWRCWRSGGRSGIAFEVIERDDGFISVLDVVRYLQPADALGPLDRWACEQACGRVLDVGCGAGRHALALMARGLDVTGLDPSAGAVRVAAGRGVRAIRGSADSLPSDLGSFDTLLLLGHNLGLLESRQRAGDVLATLATLVRPGGRLIGSAINPYWFKNPEQVAYLDFNRARSRMPGQQRIRVRDGCVSSAWFDYLTLSIDELRGLVAGSPWTLADSAEDGEFVVTLVHQ
jgi:SAM-dependent methyltransferase